MPWNWQKFGPWQPGVNYGDPLILPDPGEALPPPTLPNGGTGGGGTVPTDGTFAGWTPPNGTQYGPGSAPGYGTYNDPERAGFNLFQDARSWLAANPQIFNPYGGQMTAQLSPLQQQARMGLGGFLGGDPYGMTTQAADMARMGGMYQPQNVTAAQAAYTGDVTGGSFTSGDWGAYMNPFTSNVIDATMGDLERQRQIANQQGARSASASSYGGDRNALIEAETNRGFGDIMARTSAQLRSQGFDTAAGLMGQDLSRGFQAQIANQGMRQGLNQYNTAALNNMGQFNAGLGLQGAGLRLDAANTLGGLGNQYFNQNLTGASALNQFGTQDQMTNQADLDATYNEYLRTVYGPMQGYNFLGGLMSGTGYNAQMAGGPSKGQSALGGGLTTMGALAPLAAAGGPIGLGGLAIGTGLGALGGWLFG